MTIEELRKLNNEDNYCATLQKLNKLYDIYSRVPSAYHDTEKNLAFWSNFLDNVKNEKIKQILFVMFSELAWYKSLNFEKYDSEQLEELFKALEEERCFCFQFKPGDYIKKPTGDVQKVISITMNDANCYPIVNVECSKRVTEVKTYTDTIKYPDCANYVKVDEPTIYSDISEDGEYLDEYWA